MLRSGSLQLTAALWTLCGRDCWHVEPAEFGDGSLQAFAKAGQRWHRALRGRVINSFNLTPLSIVACFSFQKNCCYFTHHLPIFYSLQGITSFTPSREVSQRGGVHTASNVVSPPLESKGLVYVHDLGKGCRGVLLAHHCEAAWGFAHRTGA